MAGVNGRRIVAILVFGMLASFEASVTAFAQAGSTGGTIGKQDKSISGVEDTTDSHHSVPTEKASSVCRSTGNNPAERRPL
jgi:hypothetical protein